MHEDNMCVIVAAHNLTVKDNKLTDHTPVNYNHTLKYPTAAKALLTTKDKAKAQSH